MSTIYDPRYIRLIEHLIALRKQARMTQEALAAALGLDQSTVSKVEGFDRRLDLIELHDWLSAIGADHAKFLRDVDWMTPVIDTSLPAVPVPGKARSYREGLVDGTMIEMAWQGHKREVFIARLPVEGYLSMERDISALFGKLNASDGGKNRDAIHAALTLAIDRFPDVNPSDLYHHVVYRLYLRDYQKTQADRSWVRAGGEAFELFLQEHYNRVLEPDGISVVWLKNDASKENALREMGIRDEVGKSKLDLALYGVVDGKPKIFGGLHAKASLAERVSDDVPCSEAMMRRGFGSYLITLDAKSFPPPIGDLVNRGELGTPDSPSDKRKYIENHGSFTACFSYNLRTSGSSSKTGSGRLIHSSTFDPTTDPLPAILRAAWNACRKAQNRKRQRTARSPT